MKLTPAAFVTKWVDRFQPNIVFRIQEQDFQEFATDIADTFGVTLPTVPPYVAGTTYPKDFLVRYTPVGGQEAFYYSLTAGVLTAPGPGNLVDWKVVPGPTTATALSQEITLSQAQGIDQDQVVAGRTYVIDFGPDAQGNTRIVSLIGVSNNSFATSGTLEINGQRFDVENVKLQAGTFAIRYSRPQLDQLLAAKQGAVTQQYLFSAYGPGPHALPAAAFSKTVRVFTTGPCIVLLPTPTAADAGKIIKLWNNASSSEALASCRAVLGSDTTSTYVGAAPANYNLLVEVIELTRGAPFNDVVYGYDVLANSAKEPVQLLAQIAQMEATAYSDQQARAAQLNRVAPAGTTTITLAGDDYSDYGTLTSGRFTIDATGAALVIGKSVYFNVDPGGSAPNFMSAQPSQPYNFDLATSFDPAKRNRYALRVFADSVEVINIVR